MAKSFIVVDPSNVLVNGEPAGDMISVLCNHCGEPGEKKNLLDAYHFYHADLTAKHAANLQALDDQAKAQALDHQSKLTSVATAHEAHCKDLCDQHAAKIAELTGKQADALTDRDKQIAHLKATVKAHEKTIADKEKAIADRNARITLLGGEQLARERHRAKLIEERKRLDEKIDALQVSTPSSQAS